MKFTYNKTELLERRRELRRNSTVAELKLWQELRNSKLGVKFRRQASIGNYIADFYAPSKRVVIEVDGGYHNSEEIIKYDYIREETIKAYNITVLRFCNEEVLKKINEVLNKIKENIT